MNSLLFLQKRVNAIKMVIALNRYTCSNPFLASKMQLYDQERQNGGKDPRFIKNLIINERKK
jgi:hypothetical protein